jgi:hypothetical protein
MTAPLAEGESWRIRRHSESRAEGPAPVAQPPDRPADVVAVPIKPWWRTPR